MILSILILILAAWIAFVRSSAQAAICLLFLSLSTQQLTLLLITACLLFISLLIPKPNPRHQKRRFQIGKASYVALVLYTAWILRPHVLALKPIEIISNLHMYLSENLIGSFTLFAFVVYTLFTRQHVR